DRLLRTAGGGAAGPLGAGGGGGGKLGGPAPHPPAPSPQTSWRGGEGKVRQGQPVEPARGTRRLQEVCGEGAGRGGASPAWSGGGSGTAAAAGGPAGAEAG